MAAADKKISLRHRVGGVLTDPTTVKFSSPDGTYGMRRVDTLAVVVADDSVIPRDADEPTGVFSYKLTSAAHDIQLLGLQAGVAYDYWLEWVYNGRPKWQNQQFTATLAEDTPVSLYTTYNKFVRRWGTKNVAEASEPDNKATVINVDAVQDAFIHADGEIEDELRGGVLAVPLDFTPWNKIPAKVAGWAEVIAFSYLYTKRGWQEKNKLRDRMAELLADAYREMALVKNGLKDVNAAPNVDSSGDTVSLEASTVSLSPEIGWRRWQGSLTYVWYGSNLVIL